MANAGKPGGTYVTGDFHNHTTCSDGSISMQKLVSKSTNGEDVPWGLDWFVQAGHGGNGNRNCTLVEDESLATPAYPLVTAADGTTLLGPNTTWLNSNPPISRRATSPEAARTATCGAGRPCRNSSIRVVEYLAALQDKPLFLGVESVVAGHEHTSMSVITGQVPASIYSAALPTHAGLHAARQRRRAGEMAVLLRSRQQRLEPRQHHGRRAASATIGTARSPAA